MTSSPQTLVDDDGNYHYECICDGDDCDDDDDDDDYGCDEDDGGDDDDDAGPDWALGADDERIPFERVYVADNRTDTAATINAKVSSKRRRHDVPQGGGGFTTSRRHGRARIGLLHNSKCGHGS